MYCVMQSKNHNILLIGVGGGGCNALSYIYKNNAQEMSFLAINTEQEQLKHLPIPAGNQLLVKCIDKSTENNCDVDIPLGSFKAIQQRLLFEKPKIVIIIAAFGGNTGTGLASIIAKIARELGYLTLSVISLPFSVEGQRRCKRAESAISKIQDTSDGVFLFSNDYIINSSPRLNLVEAFRKSDSLFELPVRIIHNAIFEKGMINVDYADITSVLKNSGLSAVTLGTGRGESRVQEAIDNIVVSPFIEDMDVSSTTAILVQIRYGKDELTLDEVKSILDSLQDQYGSSAHLIWGVIVDDTLNDEIVIEVLLAGIFKRKLQKLSIASDYKIGREIPAHIAKSVSRIKSDNNGKKIAFLIMQFGTGTHYDSIVKAIKLTLANQNIVVLRADEKQYHTDLYYNILSYIYASDFGIAVFERIKNENYNPNVAFEVGYMFGINKEVCLLKECSLKSLHTDIIGRIYKEFDIQDIEHTIANNLTQWCADNIAKN